MNSMKVKFAVLLLIVGLLSACAAPPTAEPTIPPTEEVATATTAPTNAPAATDTSAPTAEPTAEPTTANSPTAEAAAAGTTVSFATDILPLFQSRCINCHGGNKTEEGLSLRTYADVMTGSEGGAVIIPGDVANSVLHEMVSTQEMPKRGPKLTPAQVQLIADWISEGALDN